MPSPRWLARLAIPMMVGAALFNSAPIATADATNDAYLAQLRTIGFSWPPDHDDALIAMAFLICDDRGWSLSKDQIAKEIHANLDGRGVQFGDVVAMVNLAESSYCPVYGHFQ